MRRPAIILIFSLTTVLYLSPPGIAQADNPTPPQSLPAAADAAPEAVVDSLEQSLLNSMQTDLLNHTGRSERLQPVIARAFNFPRMGRFLFGSRWNEFGASEQARFSAAFSALTVANYAARFTTFNNERFAPVSAAQPGENRAQVRHELITGKGERIAFDYLLLRQHGEWRIVNITTRGVSDLALKRSQYSKLFETGGLDAVVEYIQTQTQRMAEE